MNVGVQILCVGIMLLTLACGGGSGSDYHAPPAPPPAEVSWDQVKAILAANCAKCHDGTKEPALTPEATFRASAAKAKLTAGVMPPAPNVLSGADKQALLSFLK